MNRLKFILSCGSLSITANSRKIQTFSVLLARKRNKTHDIQGDPGIQHMKKTFEYDEEHLEQLCDEHDVDDDVDDFDLEYFRNSHEEQKGEEEWKRTILGRQIAKKHFFKPRQQPKMLTWVERRCMKYLHKKDPLKWSIHALAESFPATPEIVEKVLKVNYIISPEKEKNQDLKVRENWKLLAENKLDGDPEFLEHCKKFVNNRDVIIDYVESSDFYLSEKTEEKFYNCGEMSSILTEYEKALDAKLLANEIISKKDKGTENVKQNESKSSLELLHEKIDEEKAMIDLEGKDSFKLNMESQNSRKQMTYEQLENSILEKAEKGQDLNILEKCILEKKLSTNYPKSNKSNHKMKFKQLDEDISKTNKLTNIKTSKNDSDFYPTSLLKEKQLPYKNISFEDEYEKTVMDKNILDVENLGEVLHFDENTVTFKKEHENEVVKKKNVKKLKTAESVSVSNDCLNENKTIDDHINNSEVKLGIENDRILITDNTIGVQSSQLFESVQKLEEEDSENQIKYSCEKSKDKKVSEDLVLHHQNDFSIGQIKREEMEGRNSAPEIYSKISHSSVSTGRKEVEFEDYYPERITIPKEKRKLGSLFKVGDCYYDIDGRFLYKVPGMTK